MKRMYPIPESKKPTAMGHTALILFNSGLRENEAVSR